MDETQSIIPGKSVKAFSSAVEAAQILRFDNEAQLIAFEWIVSQAPPIYPPPPVPVPQLVGELIYTKNYSQWSQQNIFHVLHLHGTVDVSPVSRQLVQHLNSRNRYGRTKNADSPGQIVYFEFSDKNNAEGQMRHMLAYFISMMLFCSANWMHHIEGILHRRSWSLEELMWKFHLLQIRFEDRYMCFAVGRLDLCEEKSLQVFLKHMELATANQWKRPSFILTSQGDKDHLSKYPMDWIKLDVRELGAELYDVNRAYRTSTPPSALSAAESRALSYISHAQIPLSSSELECLLNLDSEDESDRLGFNDTSQVVERIQEMVNHPMTFQNKRLQLFGPHEGENTAKVHQRFVLNSLSFLRKPSVQNQMSLLCQRHEGLLAVPTSPSRSDLMSYAIKHWPVHFQLAGSETPIKEVCEFLCDREVALTWSQAFRTLSNPATRGDCCHLSPIPLAAMLGLEDVLSSLVDRLKDEKSFEVDCQLAFTESVRHGHSSLARTLLELTIIDDSTLANAIRAAPSLGPSDSLYELTVLASQRHEFQWPTDLLFRVAMIGDHRAATVLLDAGMEVDLTDEVEGSSPLHFAVLYSHEEVVKLLIDRAADLKFKDEHGRTAVSVGAFALTSRAIFSLLIASGSDVNEKDSDGCTPLQLAMTGGNVAAAEELLKAGADIEIGEEDEESFIWKAKPLMYRVRANCLEGARLLLQYKADVNCVWRRRSPLWIAVQEQNLEICRLLLEHGANPNYNGTDLDMILLVAVERPSLEIVKLLIDHGADIEQEDNDGSWRNTALSRVAGTPHTHILNYLLELHQPADVAHVGNNSSSPLYVAATEGQTEHVRILLKAGADSSLPTGPGAWLPIHAAHKSPETIEVLLSHGSDIDATCARGTVLHFAVLEENFASLKMLLNWDPKPNLELLMPGVTYLREEDTELTPLSVACAKNNGAFVRWFMEAGANPNHQTRAGRRPLDMAIENNSMRAFEVLMEYRVSVDHVDDEGNTVLHRINQSTPINMFRALVNAGASITAANNKGFTPLQVAVDLSNISAVKLLLSTGVSPNQFGPACDSLLHIACENRDLIMLRTLVEGGANVLKADTLNDAPRLLTSVLDNWNDSEWDPLPPLLSYLVEECDVDKSRRGGRGDVPLITACYYSFIPQARYLLRQGADPDMKDGSGRRALHLTALNPDLRLLDLLHEFEAETTCGDEPIMDNIGRTPVHFAAVGANWNTFRAICELYDEGELHRPDDRGWTPLFWALLSPKASIQIVQHLIDHGADLWMTAKGLNYDWSPLKLARYIGVSDEILGLLVPDRPTRHIEPEGGVERWIDEDHYSRKARTTKVSCYSCRVVCPIYFCHIVFQSVANIIASLFVESSIDALHAQPSIFVFDATCLAIFSSHIILNWSGSRMAPNLWSLMTLPLRPIPRTRATHPKMAVCIVGREGQTVIPGRRNMDAKAVITPTYNLKGVRLGMLSRIVISRTATSRIVTYQTAISRMTVMEIPRY